MALMLKTQRDGSLRGNWYGVYTESDGKRKVVSLKAKIQGTPPASKLVGDVGDTEFENSREKAKKELDGFVEESRRKGRAGHLAERLFEAKTGSLPEYVKLKDIRDKWLSGKEYNSGYVRQCNAIFKRFLIFLHETNKKAQFVHEVKQSDVIAFVGDIQKKLSSSTCNTYFSILRSVFDLCLPYGSPNPFRQAKRELRKTRSKLGSDRIHRIPFSPEEIKLLLNAAKTDDFMYSLIPHFPFHVTTFFLQGL